MEKNRNEMTKSKVEKNRNKRKIGNKIKNIERE